MLPAWKIGKYSQAHLQTGGTHVQGYVKYLIPMEGLCSASPLGASWSGSRTEMTANVMQGFLSACISAVSVLLASVSVVSHQRATSVPCCRRRDLSQYSRF